MSGEQWNSGFVWHQHIMLTQYQPTAMTFVLTLTNLILLASMGVPYMYYPTNEDQSIEHKAMSALIVSTVLI